MNELVLIVFSVAILIYSIIIHEVAHGYGALLLGDPTAKYAGRLNLNPLKHIDPLGSIVVPLIMFLSTGFAFGWAKPVPYNPYNLKDQKWGPSLVALSGPGTNIIIALVAAIAARLVPLATPVKFDIIANIFQLNWPGLATVISGSLPSIFFALAVMAISWNTLLAFFNLIPIPPLDGSKLLFAIIPTRMETMMLLEQFGFIILFLFIILFSGPLSRFLQLMLGLFLGIAI